MVLLVGVELLPVSLTDDCVRLRVEDDAIVTDGRGHHGHRQEDEADDVTQEVVLIMINVRKEVMIEHAPETSPYVHCGEETKENCKHI